MSPISIAFSTVGGGIGTAAVAQASIVNGETLVPVAMAVGCIATVAVASFRIATLLGHNARRIERIEDKLNVLHCLKEIKTPNRDNCDEY